MPDGARVCYAKAFLQTHNIGVREEKPWKGGTLYVLEACPFNPDEHSRGEAHVLEFPSGGLQFGCKHDSCQGYRWADLREKFEPGYKDRKAASAQGKIGHGVDGGFRFDVFDSPTFDGRDYHPRWLVQNVAVAG